MKRNRQSKSGRRITASVERDTQAWELRKAGCTFRQIADRLGYANPGVAHRAWRRAFKRHLPPEEDVAKERALHLARLEDMWLTLWSQYTKDARENRRPDLAIIDRLLKLMQRQAQYIPGLEVPKQVDAYVESRAQVDVSGDQGVTIDMLVAASNDDPAIADNIVELVRRLDDQLSVQGRGDAGPGLCGELEQISE